MTHKYATTYKAGKTSPSWLQELHSTLASSPTWGYTSEGDPATEPVALSAITLLSSGFQQEAATGFIWLAAQQTGDGTVGPIVSQESPCWTTSLAVLAWVYSDQLQSTNLYTQNIQHGVDRLLTVEATTFPPRLDLPLIERGVTHDTTLLGWPWVNGTHSWSEPTAMVVWAMKAAGRRDHPRVDEAVRLLIDRLLPDGGCNCGNTFVLGKTLRPHPLSTGIVLTALVDEADDSGRIEKSLDYLEQFCGPRVATVSLCHGLIALAAHGRYPSLAPAWLEQAFQKELANSSGSSPWKLALIGLAAQVSDCPLNTLIRAPEINT